MEEQERWLLSEYIKTLQEKLEEHGDIPVVWIYDGHNLSREIPFVYTGIRKKELVLFIS